MKLLLPTVVLALASSVIASSAGTSFAAPVPQIVTGSGYFTKIVNMTAAAYAPKVVTNNTSDAKKGTVTEASTLMNTTKSLVKKTTSATELPGVPLGCAQKCYAQVRPLRCKCRAYSLMSRFPKSVPSSPRSSTTT